MILVQYEGCNTISTDSSHCLQQNGHIGMIWLPEYSFCK